MLYRGFQIIVSGPLTVKKWSLETRQLESYAGVACEVYDKYDDDMVQELDTFALAVSRDIPNLRTEHIEEAVRNYVDKHNVQLNLSRNEVLADRRNLLVGRLASILGERLEDGELYDLLSENVGMTDEEIRSCGYMSLAPFFNREAYAQTIAEFMIHIGTENTLSGNWHFSFEHIDKRFGLDLKNDEEMVKLVCEELYKQGDIVSEVDIYDNDFDLMFYLDSCPYADDEGIRSNAYDQQI